jgi:hypothetical protein
VSPILYLNKPLPSPPLVQVQVGWDSLVGEDVVEDTFGDRGGIVSMTTVAEPEADQFPAASRSCTYRVCEPCARFVVGVKVVSWVCIAPDVNGGNQARLGKLK